MMPSMPSKIHVAIKQQQYKEIRYSLQTLNHHLHLILFNAIFAHFLSVLSSFTNRLQFQIYLFPNDGFILTKKPDKSPQISLYAISASKHLDLLSAGNIPKEKTQTLVLVAFQTQPSSYTTINSSAFVLALKEVCQGCNNYHLSCMSVLMSFCALICF